MALQWPYLVTFDLDLDLEQTNPGTSVLKFGEVLGGIASSDRQTERQTDGRTEGQNDTGRLGIVIAYSV